MNSVYGPIKYVHKFQNGRTAKKKKKAFFLYYNTKWIKARRALNRKPARETAISSSDSDNASQTITSKYIRTPDIPIIANENRSDENEECSIMFFTPETPIEIVFYFRGLNVL